MPYINVKTNVKVENKYELQKNLGEIIRIIPGKTPERTMILIDDLQAVYFAATDEPCAMVETQVNAGTDQSTVKEYCFAVIDHLSKTYDIPETRIYVNVNAQDNWYSK